jgi:hypothetical protein
MWVSGQLHNLVGLPFGDLGTVEERICVSPPRNRTNMLWGTRTPGDRRKHLTGHVKLKKKKSLLSLSNQGQIRVSRRRLGRKDIRLGAPIPCLSDDYALQKIPLFLY